MMNDYFAGNIRNFEITPDADSLESTITSPFFPIHYPKDYRAQYNIKCSSKIKENCRIKIFFLDYQIAPQSLLEVNFDDHFLT